MCCSVEMFVWVRSLAAFLGATALDSSTCPLEMSNLLGLPETFVKTPFVQGFERLRDNVGIQVRKKEEAGGVSSGLNL